MTRVIPTIEPEVPDAEPIPISSSDSEHSDDLAYNPPQLVGEFEIAHSFKEDNRSDTSSGSTNMAPRFRTLSQKKSMPASNPFVVY